MARTRMTHQDLFDHLAAADATELRLVLEHGLQRLVELEASAVIGAAPYERSSDRTTHRNGYRSKLLDTGLGRLECRSPSFERAASSQPCWNHAGGSTGPSWR